MCGRTFGLPHDWVAWVAWSPMPQLITYSCHYSTRNPMNHQTIFLLILVPLTACSPNSFDQTASTGALFPPTVLSLTEDTFAPLVLQSSQPVIVYFWAPWCPRCKALKPGIERLSTQLASQAQVGQVNIDTNRFLKEKYSIENVPALLVFQQGEVVHEFKNPGSQGDLSAMVASFVDRLSDESQSPANSPSP